MGQIRYSPLKAIKEPLNAPLIGHSLDRYSKSTNMNKYRANRFATLIAIKEPLNAPLIAEELDLYVNKYGQIWGK